MEATGLRMDRAIIDEQVQDLMEERDSSLAAFIEMLDTELPEDAKLPRLEDGSYQPQSQRPEGISSSSEPRSTPGLIQAASQADPGSKTSSLIGIEPTSIQPTNHQ